MKTKGVHFEKTWITLEFIPIYMKEPFLIRTSGKPISFLDLIKRLAGTFSSCAVYIWTINLGGTRYG
jgi:hypothetical protein